MSEPNERAEFLRACEICKADAKESGFLRYVKRRTEKPWNFVVTGDGNNWLFRAYPGGRMVLSMDGKVIAGIE